MPRDPVRPPGRIVHFCVTLCAHGMKAGMDELLTTREAAERLGVTDSRIRQMVLREQLPAIKKGRDLLIKASDLRLVEDRPKGRPKQTARVLMAQKAARQSGAKKGDRK